MPLSRLTIKKILRSEGCSAVGTAAYCSAQKLLDEVQGIEFDFSKKEGLVYSEILAPEGAPAWIKDRSVLWNTIERIEKRKDAYLAREVMVVLPSELTAIQHINVLKAFCQSQFVDKGMVADVNLYLASVNNPFAYVLLTTREIEANGFGLKNADWYKRKRVFEYRKALENLSQMISTTPKESS